MRSKERVHNRNQQMPLFIIYIQPLTSFRDSFSVGIKVYSLQDNQEALWTEDKCSNWSLVLVIVRLLTILWTEVFDKITILLRQCSLDTLDKFCLCCTSIQSWSAPLRTILKNLILLIVGHYSSRIAVPRISNRSKFMTNFFQQIGHKFYDKPYSVKQSENHSRWGTKKCFRCRKVNAVMSICSGQVWHHKPLSAMEPACKVNYCIQTTCSEAIKWESVWGHRTGTKDIHWYCHHLGLRRMTKRKV